MDGYIYLIESLNGKNLYLGSTNNPRIRISEHNNGKCVTTKKYKPWRCVLIIKMGTLTEARKVEYYIKKQKEKLSVVNVIKNLNRYLNIK